MSEVALYLAFLESEVPPDADADVVLVLGEEVARTVVWPLLHP